MKEFWVERCPETKPASLTEEPSGESQWISIGSAYSLQNSTLHAFGSGFLSQPYRSSAGCFGSHFAGAISSGFVCTHLLADHFVSFRPGGQPAWSALRSPRPEGWKLYQRTTVPRFGFTLSGASQLAISGSELPGQWRWKLGQTGWPCFGKI